MFLIIINRKMQVIETNDDGEQKLLEEKREKMYELIKLNNVSIKENVTLLINDWCKEHIKILHKEYPHTEWLAVCKIEPQGNGIFLMTDMIFPGQRGMGADVTTTEEGMKRLNEELRRRKEDFSLWNCFLHSHHSMGCFWSDVDDKARKGLNDGRQMAWAVVTAYDKDKISYKGCVNFYKPYNIEIDVDVKDIDGPTIIERYNDYLTRITESEVAFYEFLTEENKEYIDSITERPSYSNVLDYLGVDITEELNTNYDGIKEKIGNPELLDYLDKLKALSHRLAVEEVHDGGKYEDTLVEYGAFCDWSDKMLDQLEENRKTKIETEITYKSSYPTNRIFDCGYGYSYGYDYDNDSYPASKYSEEWLRREFNIDKKIRMAVSDDDNEWLVWSDEYGEYLYLQDYVDEFYHK